MDFGTSCRQTLQGQGRFIPVPESNGGSDLISASGGIEDLALRHRAEQRLRETPGPGRAKRGTPSEEELARVFHELQVHQIELDMQAEELRRTQLELAEARARRRSLPASASAEASRSGLALASRLSAREREVLGLVVAGLRSKEIADRLGIGLRTVESHRWRIMRKLEVNNGPGMVKFALDHGLAGAG